MALAPPTAIAIIVALEERGEARRNAQMDLLDATRVAAVDAESAVDATASFLSAVADDLSARPGVEHCERLLSLVPRATDWYSAVGVATPERAGLLRHDHAGLGRPLTRVDVSGADWFRRAQAERGFVMGEVGEGPLSHMKVLLASHAVDRGRFERPAVLFAALDVDELTSDHGVADSPTDTKYVLLDDRGKLVARVPDDPSGASEREQRPLVSTVLREREGTAELMGLDGVRRSTASRPWEAPAGAACSSRGTHLRERVRATRTTTCAATSYSPGWASWRRSGSAT